MSADLLNVRIRPDHIESLKRAALSRVPVSLGPRRTSSPHEFYRYPARFSPAFARAVIAAFSQPGDLVLDPFGGGGTTAVEALQAGRQCLVADLNPLATFITRVKTCPLQPASALATRLWLDRLAKATSVRRAAPNIDVWVTQGYLKDLATPLTWRITKVIRLALSAIDLSDPDSAAFCRCVILRTAQWALDMRSTIPSVDEFRRALIQHGYAMLRVAAAYAEDLPSKSYIPYVINKGLPGLADHVQRLELQPPNLVVTSPPYPGAHPYTDAATHHRH